MLYFSKARHCYALRRLLLLNKKELNKSSRFNFQSPATGMPRRDTNWNELKIKSLTQPRRRMSSFSWETVGETYKFTLTTKEVTTLESKVFMWSKLRNRSASQDIFVQCYPNVPCFNKEVPWMSSLRKLLIFINYHLKSILGKHILENISDVRYCYFQMRLIT